MWLRKRLFADPPPTTTARRAPLEKKDDAKLSLKEQIARHRENAACARCHNKIDPWGIAFEATIPPAASNPPPSMPPPFCPMA